MRNMPESIPFMIHILSALWLQWAYIHRYIQCVFYRNNHFKPSVLGAKSITRYLGSIQLYPSVYLSAWRTGVQDNSQSKYLISTKISTQNWQYLSFLDSPNKPANFKIFKINHTSQRVHRVHPICLKLYI